MDPSWVLGIGVALIAGGALVLLARWLESCPSCGSLMGPKAVSKAREKNPSQSVVDWQCRKCGHRWEVVQDHAPPGPY